MEHLDRKAVVDTSEFRPSPAPARPLVQKILVPSLPPGQEDPTEGAPLWIIDNFIKPEVCKFIIRAAAPHMARTADGTRSRALLFEKNERPPNMVGTAGPIQGHLEACLEEAMAIEQISRDFEPPPGFDRGVQFWTVENDLNPCLRITQYTQPTDGLKYHRDAAYTETQVVKSSHTLLVYLDAEPGAKGTKFLNITGKPGLTVEEELAQAEYCPREVVVEPRVGRAVIFGQRLLHASDGPCTGPKTILRTDIKCTGVANAAGAPSRADRLACTLFRAAQHAELNGLPPKASSDLYERAISLRCAGQAAVPAPEAVEALKHCAPEQAVIGDLTFGGLDADGNYLFDVLGVPYEGPQDSRLHMAATVVIAGEVLMRIGEETMAPAVAGSLADLLGEAAPVFGADALGTLAADMSAMLCEGKQRSDWAEEYLSAPSADAADDFPRPHGERFGSEPDHLDYADFVKLMKHNVAHRPREDAFKYHVANHNHLVEYFSRAAGGRQKCPLPPAQENYREPPPQSAASLEDPPEGAHPLGLAIRARTMVFVYGQEDVCGLELPLDLTNRWTTCPYYEVNSIDFRRKPYEVRVNPATLLRGKIAVRAPGSKFHHASCQCETVLLGAQGGGPEELPIITFDVGYTVKLSDDPRRWSMVLSHTPHVVM